MPNLRDGADGSESVTEFVQFLLMKRLLKSLHLLKESGDVAVQRNEHLLQTPAGSDQQKTHRVLRKPPAVLLCLADLLPTRLSAARRPPPTLSHSRHIDMRGVTSAGCVRGPARADCSPLKKHK